MRYYQVMIGLRGCYLPDSSYIIAVPTRRELKRAIQWEAESCGDVVGLSKRAVAWAAAHSWRGGGAILPYGCRGQGKPYSIEIARATRREYLDYCEAEGV